ncbi:amino acid permease/transporter, putative [Trypanosoma equiperdum]|uniref:Amino acid permease/transporter, putative n=2 Tax=Trypanozoon TaxID=39700 RepID=Q385A1_TRYB2|nr:amino acid permease/transporter, putative [Trypanosoma brucei brucei TREU927]EAN79630.1 amino acid permease/transporter, putative [Trypanosoma brucei brucei TREU927]SCU70769.1 amino acid permease/transporter, putative [Trypanosoma equiperdum]
MAGDGFVDEHQYFEHPRYHIFRQRQETASPIESSADVEGQTNDGEQQFILDKGAPKRSLSVPMLMGLMYAYTTSGAYAIEETVLGGGPLLGIISIVLVPLLMAAPTTIVVAELATAIPSNAAFLMWYNVSFHRVVYFAMVLLTFLLIFIDNALYTVLISEYVCTAVPCSDTISKLLRLGMVLVTYTLNMVGVQAVGKLSIALSIVTVAPFLTLFSMHMIKSNFYLNWPAISYIPPSIDWATFITTTSWNLCGLEQAATVIEQTKAPRRTFIRALAPLLGLAYLTYIPPILTGASIREGLPDLSQWVTGFWSDVAFSVGGVPLRVFMVVASALSAHALLLSSFCTTTQIIAGVAYTEAFPGPINRVLYKRNKRFGTYHWTLTLNAVLSALFGVFLEFGPLVKVDQVLYGLRVLMIFIAFLVIRHRHPHLKRPFRAPFEGKLLYLLIIPMILFAGLIVLGMVESTQSVIVNLSVLGVVMVISLVYCQLVRKEDFYGRIVTGTLSEDEKQ